MIYAEKEQNESPFVSVDTVARGRILPPRKEHDGVSAVSPYSTKKQETPKPSAQNDEMLQLKKSDSDEKSLEGIGENTAKNKKNNTNPIESYEKFEAEVKKHREKKQQRADAFWATKGIVAAPPPLSKTNISYRNSLTQKVGGSNTSIIQASLVVIGYDLGTYGPDKNGVDGHIGSVTEKAIKEFQKATGLTPTGKVDGQTMTALDLVVEAGLKKDDIRRIGIDSGHSIKDDNVVETARQYIKAVNYELGAKYNFETEKYENEYKYSPKHIYSEPTLDCSGFTKKVIKEATGYILADGSVNQKDQLGTEKKAIVGGLVFMVQKLVRVGIT